MWLVYMSAKPSLTARCLPGSICVVRGVFIGCSAGCYLGGDNWHWKEYEEGLLLNVMSQNELKNKILAFLF